MKRILTAILVFSSIYGWAQQKMKPGTYVSDISVGQRLLLHINDDSTFDLVVFHGKFEYVGDSVKLKTNTFSDQKFIVRKLASDTKASPKLTIKLGEALYYYSSRIFIGLDTDSDLNSLESYLNTDEGIDYQNMTFDVVRPNYLYLLDYDSEGSDVSKFEIPSDASEIDIIYNGQAMSKTANLNAIVDPTDSNQIIISDGKSPLVFKWVENGADNYEVPNEIKSQSVTKNTTFKAPELEDSYGEVSDVALEAVDVSDYQAVELPSFNSLKEALKALEASPDKFLVVSYDPKNKSAQQEFKEFKANISNSLGYYSAEGEVNIWDNFLYYLMKEEEKKEFEKFGISKTPAVFVLNADGVKIYHTEGSMIDHSVLFEPYYSIYASLLESNLKWKLDQVLQNKKAGLEDFKAVLSETMKITSPFIDDYSVETATETEVYETVEVTEDEPETDFKDAQNLYALQASLSTLQSKWLVLLKAHQADTQLDLVLSDLIKRELNNDGFTIKLFKQNSSGFGEHDRLAIDYLIKFNDEIQGLDQAAVENYDETGYLVPIKQVISLQMDRVLNAQTDTSVDKQQAMQYYREVLKKTKYSFELSKSYLYALDSNEDLKSKEFLNIYQMFYQNALPSQDNVVEQLDGLFTGLLETNSFYDWPSFKYEFSELANTAAWYVVTESASAYYSDAIKWSETSLKLNKNNAYFLDTLAQLYYKNGDKTKAIETQQNAISNIKEEEDPGGFMEMNDVLKRMQTGSY
jgi:hypothetical protein